MKKNTKRSRTANKPLPFPGTVPSHLWLEKALDVLLMFLICLGMAAGFMFLLTM